MPLTVLKTTPASSPDDLIRLFHQSQLEWSRHVGEETQLDFGRWISNPNLPSCSEANCLLDAFVVPGTSAADVIREMDEGVRACTLNSSVPAGQTDGLTQMLLDNGWTARPIDIRHLSHPHTQPHRAVDDLTIIPARASYRHYRELMDRRGQNPEAAMLHLDDSHFDALLALKAGKAVACIGVLISGEIGTVREWYVVPDARDPGIGRLLLDRAIEICLRSQLRHVMIGLTSPADVAGHLCDAAGFKSVGQTTTFYR